MFFIFLYFQKQISKTHILMTQFILSLLYMNIKSTYKSFDVKQQRNTFFYYNHVICKFLKRNFDWFTKITNDKYNEITKKIQTISSSKSKEHIEPYHIIYINYLSKYTDIFKKNATFVDCGCAPGGFLKFATDQQMKGYGLTLPQSKTNKALELKYDVDVIYGDLLDESFLESLENKIKEKVDFVNMGAVLYDKDNDLLDQNRLFLNQFYVAKKFLKPGGTIMFVLDIFYTLFNLLMIGTFFVERKCKISFIPVQPTFQTTQVYVIIENINFSDEMFQKFFAMKQQGFVPIIGTYSNFVEKLFTSSYLNIDSFKEAYLINLLSKKNIIKEDNTITYNLLPTMMLDVLTKSNYNLRYVSYKDFTKIYKNTGEVYELVNKKISKKRDKFISDNKLPVDSNGDIKVKEVIITANFLRKVNKFVKKNTDIFLNFVITAE